MHYSKIVLVNINNISLCLYKHKHNVSQIKNKVVHCTELLFLIDFLLVSTCTCLCKKTNKNNLRLRQDVKSHNSRPKIPDVIKFGSIQSHILLTSASSLLNLSNNRSRQRAFFGFRGFCQYRSRQSDVSLLIRH